MLINTEKFAPRDGNPEKTLSSLTLTTKSSTSRSRMNSKLKILTLKYPNYFGARKILVHFLKIYRFVILRCLTVLLLQVLQTF